MIRVDVRPEMLRWARERAGLTLQDLKSKFPRLNAWERGDSKPTLKQLESMAKVTHAPIGYLFLSHPPDERLPIPDLRTIANRSMVRPSPDLLDTIYVCQQRQSWYQEFARINGEESRSFVGSVRLTARVETVAKGIRDALGFDLEARRRSASWSEALRMFIGQAEEIGLLVMCSGVVLNNNKRKLDPDEFRGFAMADDLAPLVFINGSDTRAAQMFTLAHEIAHIWIGKSALTDAGPFGPPDPDAGLIAPPDIELEAWCNRVAAELLVPLDMMNQEFSPRSDLTQEMERLARRFKVSTLVILRRVFDLGGLSRRRYSVAYEAELERLLGLARGSGGNFYLTQAVRVSKRFARALVASTLEGQTLYSDAFRMLGISKIETLRELGKSLDSPG